MGWYRIYHMLTDKIIRDRIIYVEMKDGTVEEFIDWDDELDFREEAEA